jgi:hypothetical protein
MPDRPKFSKTATPDELHPALAEGLTVGASAEEAFAETQVSPSVPGVEVVKHMRDADKRLARDGRAPFAPFVAASSLEAVWHDGATERLQADVHKTYTEAGMALLREGRQCLRCDEPQPVPFPELCDLCGYPMRDRQSMDIGMEFAGTKHLGPAAPISQYLEEQEERVEKARFEQKILEGKSRGRHAKTN